MVNAPGPRVPVTAASEEDHDTGQLVQSGTRLAVSSIVLIWADGSLSPRKSLNGPLAITSLSCCPDNGGGAHAVRAGALPPSGPGLRAAAGTCLDDGQVGRGRKSREMATFPISFVGR